MLKIPGQPENQILNMKSPQSGFNLKNFYGKQDTILTNQQNLDAGQTRIEQKQDQILEHVKPADVHQPLGNKTPMEIVSLKDKGRGLTQDGILLLQRCKAEEQRRKEARENEKFLQILYASA